MSRFVRGALFVAFPVAFFGLVAGTASISLAQDGPCKAAGKGDGPIDKACVAGGLKEAKKAMKDLVKAAKVGGVKFACDDCHKDDKDYAQFTDDAKEKFKKLLAAAAKK